MISCKGHLAPFIFFLPGKPILVNFQTAPFVYNPRSELTGDSDWFDAHVNISLFEEWLNIIGSVPSSYQANLMREIPNITESYINSHVFTCQH